MSDDNLLGDLGDLVGKLDEYQKQLSDVESLLRMTPADESLLKLKEDLTQVIELTTSLAGVPPSSSSSSPSSSSPSSSSSSSQATDVPPPSHPALASVPPPPPPTYDAQSAQQTPATQYQAQPQPQLYVQAQAHIPGEVSLPPVPTYREGQRVTAVWSDGKWYSARITEVNDTNYTVQYLDYGNIWTVTPQQMKEYEHASEKDLKKGTLVRAIWPNDSMFYNARIDSKDPEKIGFYNVKFTQFEKNTKYSVSVYDLKLRTKDPNEEVGEVGEFSIPVYLAIKDTDTAEQKAHKWKKIKRLKKKHTQVVADEASKKRTRSWKDFQMKKKKKSKTKQKKSIFATNDNVRGRVGVLNSGTKMTRFKKRGRHAFEAPGVTEQE